MGRALLQCSECSEQNIIAILKTKGGAVVTKMWAVSWDKCSGKAGVRERHTFSIQEKLERSRSDEMLGCGRTGMMAHSNHERDTSAVLRKSFKSSLCYQQTAGISQEGIVQLWIQTAKFFISSFAGLCLGLRVVFHKNVSWIRLRLNVLTEFLVWNALLWKHH